MHFSSASFPPMLHALTEEEDTAWYNRKMVEKQPLLDHIKGSKAGGGGLQQPYTVNLHPQHGI